MAGSDADATATRKRIPAPGPQGADAKIIPLPTKLAADAAGVSGSLKDIAGSAYDVLNNVLANQALSVLWKPRELCDESKSKQVSAALAAMLEFKPEDGVEGMMAAQAVGLHSASIECMRRAMIPEQSGEACAQLRRQAANLSRAFLDVVAALDRKRGKGGQHVVRVERVVVQEGGQAIVGAVTGQGRN